MIRDSLAPLPFNVLPWAALMVSTMALSPAQAADAPKQGVDLNEVNAELSGFFEHKDKGGANDQFLTRFNNITDTLSAKSTEPPLSLNGLLVLDGNKQKPLTNDKSKSYTVLSTNVTLTNENPEGAVLLIDNGVKDLKVFLGTDKAPLENLTIKSVAQNKETAVLALQRAIGSQINLYAKNIHLESLPANDKAKGRNVLGFYGDSSTVVKQNQINVEATDSIVINGNIGNGVAQGFDFKSNKPDVQNDVAGMYYRGEENSIFINQTQTNNPTVKITGTIATNNSNRGRKNQIWVRMTTKDSFLKGQILDWNFTELKQGEGTTLELTNGAIWQLTNGDSKEVIASQLNTLTLNAGSQVLFDRPTGGYKKIIVHHELKTTDPAKAGGTFVLNIDPTQKDKSDQLSINGEHTGTHYIAFDKRPDDERADGTKLVFVGKEKGEFKLTDAPNENVFVKYSLEKETNPKDQKTVWFLKASKQTPKLVPQVLDYARDKYALLLRTDSYRARTGMNPHHPNNLWARVRHHGVTSVESGYTHQFASMGLTQEVGAGIEYGQKKGFKDYGVNVYYTQVYPNGLYWDNVAAFHSLKNTFKDGLSGLYVSGDTRQAYTKVSTEVGLPVGLGHGLSVEPSAQVSLMRVAGPTYMLKDGFKVHEKAYTSLVGRLGVTLSKAWDNGLTVYAKGDVLREMKGKQDLVFKDVHAYGLTHKGTWFEYGVGMSVAVNSKVQVYGDFSTQARQKFKRQPSANLGVRVAF